MSDPGKAVFLSYASQDADAARRIAEALRARGHTVITPGRPDFDMMDAASTRRTLEQVKPETVVHSPVRQ